MATNRTWSTRVVTKSRDFVKAVRVKDEVAQFRFLTFMHKVGPVDLVLQRYPAETKVGEDYEEWSACKRLHWSGGAPTGACLRWKSLRDGSYMGTCTRCDEADQFKGDKSDEGNKAYRNLSATVSHLVNAVKMVRNPGSARWKAEAIVVLEITDGVMRSIYPRIMEKLEAGKEIFGAVGRNIQISHDSRRPPAKRYECEIADADDSDDLTAFLRGKEGELKDLYLERDCCPPQHQSQLGAQAPAPAEKPVEPVKAKAKPGGKKAPKLVLLYALHDTVIVKHGEEEVYAKVQTLPTKDGDPYELIVFTEVAEDGTVLQQEVQDFLEADILRKDEEVPA